jgi:dsRNA-specific ribonuclease
VNIDIETMRRIEDKLELPRFRNPLLLLQALTHVSFTYEVRPDALHNESMETKGDAYLRRSCKLYFEERQSDPDVYNPMTTVAQSNAFIGYYAHRLGIVECALFSPRFKRHLAADPESPSAYLVAADL